MDHVVLSGSEEHRDTEIAIRIFKRVFQGCPDPNTWLCPVFCRSTARCRHADGTENGSPCSSSVTPGCLGATDCMAGLQLSRESES